MRQPLYPRFTERRFPPQFAAALLVLLVLPACGPSPKTTRSTGGTHVLAVMAASSLTEVFTELGQAFEANHPGVEVEFNFASSQQLAQQLVNGARADVFASANADQMQVIIESRRTDPDKVVIFARNKLAVIYPIDQTAKVSSLSDLALPGVKILMAAPEVPVGAYTIEFLDKASAPDAYGVDFKDRVLANVVSYEASAKGVVVKVGLGEADAGIVYATDLTPANLAVLGGIDIPEELNVVAEYYIAPVTDGDRELARLWISFVQSTAGEELLEKHGFQTVR